MCILDALRRWFAYHTCAPPPTIWVDFTARLFVFRTLTTDLKHESLSLSLSSPAFEPGWENVRHVPHTNPQRAVGSPLLEHFEPYWHSYHHSRHALFHCRRQIWGVDYSTFIIHELLLVWIARIEKIPRRVLLGACSRLWRRRPGVF